MIRPKKFEFIETFKAPKNKSNLTQFFSCMLSFFMIKYLEFGKNWSHSHLIINLDKN